MYTRVYFQGTNICCVCTYTVKSREANDGNIMQYYMIIIFLFRKILNQYLSDRVRINCIFTWFDGMSLHGRRIFLCTVHVGHYKIHTYKYVYYTHKRRARVMLHDVLKRLMTVMQKNNYKKKCKGVVVVIVTRDR